MDLFEAINLRRSIRRYRDQPVPAELVHRVLDAAHLAPSWKNLQCWRFLVLQQPEKKTLLQAAFADTNPGKKALAQAPVIIVVCASPTESGFEEGKDYYLADAAIAFEHLCLAATALDLGTCWMGSFDEQSLRQSLGIPETVRVVGLTPLGYPDQAPNPRPRKTLREIAYLEDWENPLC